MSFHDLYLDVPYFVYGTLRPGMGNDWCWREQGASYYKDGQVIAPGWGLIAGGVPFAVPLDVLRYAKGDNVRAAVGALIFPGENALGLRQALDTLEGHPRAYTRVPTVVHDVMTADECIAWIYTVSDMSYAIGEAHMPIVSGDYRQETAWHATRI